MEYCVIITETLSKVVNVEADSMESAQKIVTDQYYDGKIVLGDDDFHDVEFEASIKL